MIKRTIAALGLAGSLLAPAAAIHAQSASCQYVLGFATVATSVSQVGSCLDNQNFAPNGDAVQHTSGGMLVWRKADNWTAFTDGYHTWINGPNGVQERLNTDRFDWEGNAPASSPAATPAPAPAAPPATGSSTSLAGWTLPTADDFNPPLRGLATAMIAMPDPRAVTQEELQSVSIPAGYPQIVTMPAQLQLACVNLAEDLRSAMSSDNGGGLQKGDFLCPYAVAPGWQG